jgi:hypothetical protein
MGCSHGKMQMLGTVGLGRSLSEEHLNKIMEHTNVEKEQVEVDKLLFIFIKLIIFLYQEKYRQFLTKYPKGRISRRSFQSMLSDCFPGLGAERLGQLGSHIWRIYDINEVW